MRDTVRIVVSQGSDSDEYQACVRDRRGGHWTFDFDPSGWIPRTGDHPSELRFVDDVEWPALIVTEAGILYPKYVPKREHLDHPAAEELRAPRPLPYYLGGTISLLLAGLILAGAWGAYLKDTGIVKDGVSLEAVVVRAGYLVGKRGETHGLVYRFTLPDGRAMERRWTDEDERWRGYQVGDRIRIHYDPNDPSRNFPEGEGVTSLGVTLFVSVFGLVFLFLAIVLMVGGFRVQMGAERPRLPVSP